MANYVSKELAIRKRKAPSYTPYIVADIATAPWPVATAEHSAALTKWAGNRQPAKLTNTNQLPLNAWILYRMRFVCTSDICGAWSSFGGISAQLGNLSILLHLATIASITASLLYGGLLSAHLEELARAGAERSTAVVNFAAPLSVEKRISKLHGDFPGC